VRDIRRLAVNQYFQRAIDAIVVNAFVPKYEVCRWQCRLQGTDALALQDGVCIDDR